MDEKQFPSSSLRLRSVVTARTTTTKGIGIFVGTRGTVADHLPVHQIRGELNVCGNICGQCQTEIPCGGESNVGEIKGGRRRRIDRAAFSDGGHPFDHDPTNRVNVERAIPHTDIINIADEEEPITKVLASTNVKGRGVVRRQDVVLFDFENPIDIKFLHFFGIIIGDREMLPFA